MADADPDVAAVGNGGGVGKITVPAYKPKPWGTAYAKASGGFKGPTARAAGEGRP